MTRMDSVLLPAISEIVGFIRTFPAVKGIILGGSRGTGSHHQDSDWDLVVYYEGDLNPDSFTSLAKKYKIIGQGDWGPWQFGGLQLWLGEKSSEQVDILFRRLEDVLHWTEKARKGLFEVHLTSGSIVGVPSYKLAAELALWRHLDGSLPKPTFSEELSRSASTWWHTFARRSFMMAQKESAKGRSNLAAALLIRAIYATGYERAASLSRWTLGEHNLLNEVGLEQLSSSAIVPLGVQDIHDIGSRLGY